MAETALMHEQSILKGKSTSKLPPLGARVRALREDRGWTQPELAEIADVAVRTIQNVERTGHASLDTCKALATAFGTEAAEFTRLRETADSQFAPEPEGVAEYVRSFVATRGSSVAPLVPLRAEGGPGSVSEVCWSTLKTGKHVLLCGPSGSGKSHTALHVVLQLGAGAGLPLLARARQYAGNLASWLEQAVAPFTTLSVAELLQFGTDQALTCVLVIDDLGACSPELRDSLLSELRALVLRNPTLLLLFTAVEPEQVTPFGPVETVRIVAPNVEEVRQLLVAHGLVLAEAVTPMELLPALTLPFDVSLAARCWRRMSKVTTRYALIHAFVRESLAELDVGPLAIEFLCRVAQKMSSTVTTAVELEEAYRFSGLSDSVVAKPWQRLFSSGLVRIERLQLVFRHDLLRQFFVAEALMRTTSSVESLARELDLPRLREFVGFVIEAQGTVEATRALLRLSEPTRAILRDIRSGVHGELAHAAANMEIADAIGAAQTAIESGRFFAVRDPESGRLTLSFKSPAPITDAVAAMLAHHALTAVRSDEVAACMALLGRFDSVVTRESLRSSDQDPGRAARRMASHALQFRFDSPVAPIIGALRNRTDRFSGPVTEGLRTWVAAVSGMGPIQLHGLCELLERCRLSEADQAFVGDAMPTIVSAARRCSARAARMAALSLVGGPGGYQLPEAARAAVRAELESFETDDVFLNSFIFDALEAVGVELERVTPTDDLTEEIRDLLKTPLDREAQERVSGIFGMQFESLSAIAAPASEAIEELTSRERPTFYAMAALGAPADSIFSFVDLCLERAVSTLAVDVSESNEDAPSLGGRPRTYSSRADAGVVHAALRRWAAPPPEPLRAPQDSVRAFVLANQGLALCALPPPTIAGPTTLRELAWLHFAALIYAAAKGPDAGGESAAAAWEALEGPLLYEAVTPFILVVRSASHGRPSFRDVRDLESSFPVRIADLAVKLFEKVDLLAKGPLWLPVGLSLIETLGRVAAPHVRARLLLYVDDPVLGEAALTALRSIDSRSGNCS